MVPVLLGGGAGVGPGDPGRAGEFCRWLRIAGKPAGPHWRARRAGGEGEAAAAAVAGGPLAGSPDAVTGRPAPGRTYAVATVAHCETVLRHFYDFHLELGPGRW